MQNKTKNITQLFFKKQKKIIWSLEMGQMIFLNKF